VKALAQQEVLVRWQNPEEILKALLDMSPHPQNPSGNAFILLLQCFYGILV